MRPKVLIVTPFNPKYFGGAETFCKDMITEAKKKFDVEIATMAQQFKDWDNPVGGELFFIWLALLYRALKLRVKFKYRTVHCLGITATAVGVVLKKLFKVQLISTTLAIYNFVEWRGIKRKIVRWIFKQADVRFVEDETSRFDLICLGNIRECDIKIFTHWVDLDKFKPKKLACPEERLMVLFVGRPIHKKGRHIIKQVQSEISFDKVRFVYLEDTPYERLPYYYQVADILVVPSIYDEGVARVVLEAVASGCAVISSDYGSLKDLVLPFGVPIPPTPNLFKVMILFFYNDRNKLREYQKKARQYAEKHFSNKNAQVILDEY